MARVNQTREKILEVAEAAVLAKGFEATSIDEIVAAVEITKGGFFYHFPDKNALARAMLERYIAAEDVLFDDIFKRARDLNDDPLHSFLIALKLMSEMLDDLPNGHPGCLIAVACYQDRLFDAQVREINKKALLRWRAFFRSALEDISARYPLRENVPLDDLADMFSSIMEGGIILAKGLETPSIAARQLMLYRSYVKLLFSPAH